MLLHTDKVLRSLFQPISTVTFYRGTPNLKHLRERVTAVVTANPWLAGRYQKHPETGEFPCLWVPECPDTTECFEVIPNLSVHPGMSYHEIEKSVKPFLVNKGKAWRKKPPIPPFKVIIIPSANDTFCLIVSLCHTLGDGHTFYKIYNMLSEKGTITSMDAVRVDAWHDLLNYCGEEKINWFKSLTTLGPIVLKLLLNRSKPIYRHINMEWVEKMKANHIPTPGVPWVSSNDIITSNIVNGLKMDSGVMVVDARGPIQELTQNHAGSYEVPLFYMGKSKKTPACIRTQLTGKRPPVWKTSPSRLSSLFMNIGIISSWAGWEAEILLEGCEQILHIPIFAKPMPPSIAFIWRPVKDKLAVVLNAKPSILKNFKSHPVLGSSVVN